MITDEQVRSFKETYNTLAGYCDTDSVRKGLEACEQSKPKHEPVGYIYKHRLEQMLNSEVDNDCNFFPIKDEISRVIFNNNRGKYLALYTTPPTREPLSKEQINLMAFNDDPDDWNNPNCKRAWFDGYLEGFRSAEQSHGIGVTNEST